jgi:hypothetical protein
MTDICVSSLLTAQAAWASSGGALSTKLLSNAPGFAYFRVCKTSWKHDWQMPLYPR